MCQVKGNFMKLNVLKAVIVCLFPSIALAQFPVYQAPTPRAVMQVTPLAATGKGFATDQFLRQQVIVADSSATAAGGNTVSAYISAATTNSTNVKATAGRIFSVVACGASATARYIKIYNSASAPTCGAGTPVLRLVAPANGCTEAMDPLGLAFSAGIGFCITGAAADADATAVLASDTYLTFGYK